MILEIDAGNTRLKWRCRSASTTAARVADSVSAISAELEGPRIERVHIASVRAPQFLEQLAAESEQAFAAEVTVARVSSQCSGLRINYADPSRLGVDRWLAMLAARALTPSACLVVDCGTALTLDRVSAEGEHEGGFILPGLALMRRSLEENTRIRLDSGYVPDSIELGNSTDAAVYHGTLAAAVALIQAQWSELNQASTPARLVLTGGGAGELSRQLQAQAAETVPDLVLDGLQYAIGSN